MAFGFEEDWICSGPHWEHIVLPHRVIQAGRHVVEPVGEQVPDSQVAASGCWKDQVRLHPTWVNTRSCRAARIQSIPGQREAWCSRGTGVGELRERAAMSDGSTDQPEAHSESVIGRVGELRQMREELERALLPLATSIDGRQFTFQASLHGLVLRTGGYVVLEGNGQTCLGQILAMRPDSMSVPDPRVEATASSLHVRVARGEGIILDGPDESFHDAQIRPATSREVDGWFVRVRPDRSALTIGGCCSHPGSPRASMREVSTGIPSCVGNPGPERPIR